MGIELYRKIILVVIGNLYLRNIDIESLNMEHCFAPSDTIKFMVDDNGLTYESNNYKNWLKYLIEVEKIRTFKLFYLDKEYIGEAAVSFERQNSIEKIFIECVKDKTSDFYSEIGSNRSGTYARYVYPKYKNKAINYSIKEDITHLKQSMSNSIDLMYNYVDSKGVGYLKDFFNGIKQNIGSLKPNIAPIPNNDFTLEEQQIINTFIASFGLVNVISHNANELNQLDEEYLYSIYNNYFTTATKALLKVVNKEQSIVKQTGLIRWWQLMLDGIKKR